MITTVKGLQQEVDREIRNRRSKIAEAEREIDIMLRALTDLNLNTLRCFVGSISTVEVMRSIKRSE